MTMGDAFQMFSWSVVHPNGQKMQSSDTTVTISTTQSIEYSDLIPKGPPNIRRGTVMPSDTFRDRRLPPNFRRLQFTAAEAANLLAEA